MVTTSSLQNINWLSKKVWAVYIKEKNVYCPSLIPSPYNVFLYFLEGQVHKDSKLGIMTNVGKSRLAKVVFTNVHKISDVCANSFGRYIVITQSMRNVFTFSQIQVSLEKWCFWENLVYPSTPHHYNNRSALTFSIAFKKLLAPPPFKKEGRDCILYERLQRRDN